jgi:hypothetical protein
MSAKRPLRSFRNNATSTPTLSTSTVSSSLTGSPYVVFIAILIIIIFSVLLAGLNTTGGGAQNNLRATGTQPLVLQSLPPIDSVPAIGAPHSLLTISKPVVKVKPVPVVVAQPLPPLAPPAPPLLLVRPPVSPPLTSASESCTNWVPLFQAAHDKIFTSLNIPLNSGGPDPSSFTTCPSASLTHQAFMESWRSHPGAAEGVLKHVQEIAINFDLIEETLIFGGLGEPGGSSASSAEVNALKASFKSSLRAESMVELEAALAALTGPAFFVFGPQRLNKCDPPLQVARAVAAMQSPFASKSAMIFSGPASYFGISSPECAASPTACETTSLQLSAILCAVVPKMNQGMYLGVFRVSPQVTAPWMPKIPVPIIPASLWEAYTVGGKVGIGNFYIQELVNIVEDPVTRRPKTEPVAGKEGVVIWDAAKIAGFEAVAKARGKAYYDVVDPRLYALIDRHPVKGKSVVIMGSLEPFYELVFLTFGAASVTTVEYGVRKVTDPRFEVVTPAQMIANPRKFDVAVSISSFEHDGLGRYGDALNPTGDLEAMRHLRDILIKPGGALFLAMPSGGDFIEFNAHRIYGRVRFPMLTEGWTLADSEDFKEDIWNNGGGWQMQPVYYLVNTKPSKARGMDAIRITKN